MMKKHIKKTHFTLVEILISMGVFLVLLTLLLNFFSGTRLVWKTLRERNEAFENSRVAMNLISDLMHCSVAVRDKIGFAIYKQDDNPENGAIADSANDNCLFFTHSTRDFGNNDKNNNNDDDAKYSYLDNLRVVRLSCDEAAGELLLHSQRVKGMSEGTTFDALKKMTTNKKVIIPAVSGVNFKALITAAKEPNRPVAVEVTLRMFDNKENYKYWKELGDSDKAKEFRMAHEYVFSRVISFEDVEKPIYEVSNASSNPQKDR